MKLWIWSDLHLETQDVELPGRAPPGVDVIVCAGDLCHADDLRHIARWIVESLRLPVVFVPGNHEFYRGVDGSHLRSVSVDRRLMAEAAEQSKGWSHRLHVLDDGVAEFGGVRFVGGTLWTDFALGAVGDGDLAWRMNAARSMMPDFGQIRLRGNEMLSPQAMLDMHRETRAFISHEAIRPFAGETVVVTHHLPHPACTPDIYLGSESNYLFASSEEAFGVLMEGPNAPGLWVCGHTHHPVDVRTGGTRVVCNPAGYRAARDERENGFRWDLVVDTDSLRAGAARG